MRVCITGASSTVAEKLIERLRGAHDLTLLDVRYRPGVPADLPRLTGSILDRACLRRAFAGQDAVMHLARAIENPHTTDEERWQVNVQGTLAVVQAAVDARIQKLIHASSLSVFDGYDLRLGTPGREDLEPKHGSFYGFTKHVAEIIVKQCAEQHGLRSVTLRLVAVVPDDRDLPEDLRWMLNPIIRTSGRDVAQAFQLALETPLDAPYEVFHISSGHPNRYWPHDKATRVLGYQPVDRFDAPRWVNPWTKVRRAAARDSG